MENKIQTLLDCLYDYQRDAVISTDKCDRGIICMPTGTGKTFVQGIVIAKDILSLNGKFGIYVINAPRIMLSYQLLKETYSLLTRYGIDARYMSVHSGGNVDLEDLEAIRIDANYNEGVNISFAEIENGTSPILINEFVSKAYIQNLPVVLFSTYNSADKIKLANLPDSINVVVNDEAQYLVQEQFHDIIKILDYKRCYFFTATTIHTPSDKGRGMNNVDSYGEILYMMTPREAIDKGKMVRPRLHFVLPKLEESYTKDDFQKSIGKIITEALAQHDYVIGQFNVPKMLVSVKGVGDIDRFFSSKEYTGLMRTGYKVYAVASDDLIGNNINGTKVSRRDFLNLLKEDGKNVSQRLLILHYDILAEGIDVPGITGIMPFRTLSKSKFLQTFGRAARLDPEDRRRIDVGEISSNDLSQMYKPYAWVIVPTIVHEDIDGKEHIGNLITELRDYGFVPSEDIVSTDTKHGLPTIEGLEALNEVKTNYPNIGKYIQKVEADYEQEFLASLKSDDKINYLINKHR